MPVGAGAPGEPLDEPRQLRVEGGVQRRVGAVVRLPRVAGQPDTVSTVMVANGRNAEALIPAVPSSAEPCKLRYYEAQGLLEPRRGANGTASTPTTPS